MNTICVCPDRGSAQYFPRHNCANKRSANRPIAASLLQLFCPSQAAFSKHSGCSAEVTLNWYVMVFPSMASRSVPRMPIIENVCSVAMARSFLYSSFAKIMLEIINEDVEYKLHEQ